MSTKIAVFYHVGASWDRAHSERPVSSVWKSIAAEQFRQWRESGLYEAAERIHVGVNGTEQEFAVADSLLAVGCPRARCVWNGPPDRTHWEVPTLEALRAYVKGNPEALVLYHHTKGASDDTIINRVWRFAMQHYCVGQWRESVKLLLKGYTLVGCHWLTPEQFPASVKSPFFGGNFWWGRAGYLRTLDPVPVEFSDHGESGRFAAERWVGTGVKSGLSLEVYDWLPGWPSIPLCSSVLQEYGVRP